MTSYQSLDHKDSSYMTKFPLSKGLSKEDLVSDGLYKGRIAF